MIEKACNFSSVLFVTLAILSACAFPVRADLPVEKIKLPAGFKIEVFAGNVPGARSMVRGPKGTIFVGTVSQDGKVYAIVDTNKDNKADRVITILDKRFIPNGVAFKDGSLYVAEVDKLWRLDNIEDQLDRPSNPVLVSDSFPRDTHHGWRYMRFAPDGQLYMPIGAPCNVCERKDARFAAMLRFKPGGPTEVFASGIRNSVGFDWHPVTKELWFTDNGRDWLGDDLPPDELNCAPKAGMHFGFPYRYGNNIPDPEFGKKGGSLIFTAPAVCLGPHVAALSMRFYTGNMFPENYRNQIFIAEHGSWNRSKPSGYRLMSVFLSPNKPPEYKIFAHGWLDNDHAWGRPVDLLLMPDGALLVSDDHAGAIYRISYTKPK